MAYEEKKRILFFGLPLTFTSYYIDEDNLNITEGFLTRKENDCFMYKIQDVTLSRSLMERIFGLGTVICRTGDSTHPTLKLIHIKNSRDVKNYIVEMAEEAKLRRRTINMQDISADDVEDGYFQ